MSRQRNTPYIEPITCIIPCKDAESTIERAIDSACRSGVNRVYVYDDGSKDASFEIISSLYESEKYTPILEIWSIADFRAGVVFARNYLIEQADMGLIIPLDADDELRSIDKLRQAYEPGIWLYGDYAEHNGTSVNLIVSPPPGVLARKNLCAATMLFHKRDWQTVGGYDVDFGFAEDYAFQCSLQNAGIYARHFEGIVFDRYLHPQGNERTAKATAYWTFYRDLAKSKYPSVFAGKG